MSKCLEILFFDDKTKLNTWLLKMQPEEIHSIQPLYNPSGKIEFFVTRVRAI